MAQLVMSLSQEGREMKQGFVLALALLSTACTSGSARLPGSAGPPIEILNAEPAGVRLLDARVESGDVDLDEKAAKTRALPSGTKRFRFVFSMDEEPRQGTGFFVRIENQQGPVKRAGNAHYSQTRGSRSVSYDSSSDPRWQTLYTETMTLDGKPYRPTATVSITTPGGTPHPDGPYRATIGIGHDEDARTAILNWSVGTP
jgi:hypothetical protein